MRTITIKGGIVAEPAERWCADSPACIDGFRYRFSEYANETGEDFVCHHTLTFDVPDSYDASGNAVRLLEKQREELRAKFHMALNEINNRISKLSALTNATEEV